MKQLLINKLKLKNFKGIVGLEITPDGNSLSIYGANGTGKTTIADSVSWLFFGKDSFGKTDFQIKPTDPDGNEIHNLETDVTATISINNESIELRKVFTEKWVKPRGSITTVFSGHNTEYLIDSVPTKKKDYDDFIKGIIDDSLFKILTNPLEFNSLHWQKRRETLVGICGKIEDSDIIESDRVLSAIPTILNGLSLEKKEAQNLSKKKSLVKEIDQIPARIDELTASISNVQLPDLRKKTALIVTMGSKKQELDSITSNTAISELCVKINEVDAEIISIRNSLPDVSDLKRPIIAEIERMEAERRVLTSKLADIESQIKTEEKRLSISKESRESLVAAWHVENNKKFVSDLTCQTCGQVIPEDQVKAAEYNFNRGKSQRLAEIQAEGKAQKKRIEDRELSISKDKEVVADLNNTINELSLLIGKKRSELQAVNPEIDTSKIDVLTLKKTEIQKQVQSLKSGSREKEDEIKFEILSIEKDLSIITTQEADVRAAEATKLRIEQLKEREKALTSEFEALEYELSLIKKYTTKKIQFLETKINNKFQMAQFKMFREQVSGEVEECCETMFNGVLYNSGLNNAARINTGLDIINTLSDYYQFSAPIFVDNAESVTELISTKAQVIRLVVDPNYKALTPESTTEAKAA